MNMSQSSEQIGLAPAGDDELLPQQGRRRAETIQRLQIGLFGLAAMVLIVALANVIMERAKLTEATAVPEAASTAAPAVNIGLLSDPLVDAGVVPDMPSNNQKKGAAASSPAPANAPKIVSPPPS
jgi:hypothetical protein